MMHWWPSYIWINTLQFYSTFHHGAAKHPVEFCLIMPKRGRKVWPIYRGYNPGTDWKGQDMRCHRSSGWWEVCAGAGGWAGGLAGEKVQVPPPSPFPPKLQPGSQQVKKTFANCSGCLCYKYAEERIKSLCWHNWRLIKNQDYQAGVCGLCCPHPLGSSRIKTTFLGFILICGV